MSFTDDEKKALYDRMLALEKRQSWFLGGLTAVSFFGLMIISSISNQLSEISPLITSAAVSETQIENTRASMNGLKESLDKLSADLRLYSESFDSELRSQRERLRMLEQNKHED